LLYLTILLCIYDYWDHYIS